MPNGDQESQELISALNYLGHPVDVTLQSPQVLAGGGPGAIPFPTTAEGGEGTTGTTRGTRGGGFPFQLAEDVLKLGKKASSLIPRGQEPTRVTSPVAGVGPEPAQIPGMPPPTGETLFGGPAPTVALSPEFADPLAAPGGIPLNLLQDIFGPTPQVTSGLESSLMANPALLEHAASLAPGAGVPAALEAETAIPSATAGTSVMDALSELSPYLAGLPILADLGMTIAAAVNPSHFSDMPYLATRKFPRPGMPTLYVSTPGTGLQAVR